MFNQKKTILRKTGILNRDLHKKINLKRKRFCSAKSIQRFRKIEAILRTISLSLEYTHFEFLLIMPILDCYVCSLNMEYISFTFLYLGRSTFQSTAIVNKHKCSKLAKIVPFQFLSIVFWAIDDDFSAGMALSIETKTIA